MKSLLKVFVMLLACLVAGITAAQAPEMFRYQGRLVDGTNVVNATLPMNFKLYDALSDGNKLYEDTNSVLVVDGLYSTMIGDDTVSGSLTNALTNATVYLELTVDGETLSPRERVVSVPYALNGNDGGDTAPAGSIVLSDTYPNAGLEAQGYSAVETAPGQNWTFTGMAPEGEEPQYISFAGKIWAIGSFDESSSQKIYFSDDGASWTCVATNAEISANSGFSVATFNGKMWILGGSSYSDEVWCSSDGIDWTLATETPGWSARYGLATAVFDDKLWVMGGRDSSGYKNDVWSSTDGTNWNLVTASADWPANEKHVAVAFLDKLWVIEGENDEMPMPKTTVWSSSDGITWVSEADHFTHLGSAQFSTPVVVNGKMYMPSGLGLFYTSNGLDWQVAGTGHGYWVIDAQCVSHDDSLWIVSKFLGAIARSDRIKQDNGLYYYQKDQ